MKRFSILLLSCALGASLVACDKKADDATAAAGKAAGSAAKAAAYEPRLKGVMMKVMGAGMKCKDNQKVNDAMKKM